MTSTELRARIEGAFMRDCHEERPYGALAWFARQAGVPANTVSRWVTGRRPIPPIAVRVLELLEERA